MSELEKIEMDLDRYFACDLVVLLVVCYRTTYSSLGRRFFWMTNYTTCGAATAVTTHSRLSTKNSDSPFFAGDSAID